MGRAITSHHQTKESKHLFEDRISQLPDDILITILSLLTLKEATTTSVISRRWRYLWAFVTKLDFDECSLKLRCPNIELQKFVKLEPLRYIRWVNDVVRSHRGLSLNHFKAIMYPQMMAKSQVYEWISFAIEKGSEKLELCFTPYQYSDFSDQFYRCIHSSPNGLSWIKPLKTLKLSDASVTGELLEFLLSNCPQLTILEVTHSSGLVNLRIDHGNSLQLQHLGIFYCENLKSIEIISSPNLVSFGYRGFTIRLHVENAQSLVHVSLGSWCHDNLEFAFVSLARFLSQLERLELYIVRINLGYNLRFVHGELTKLKHLILQVWVSPGESLSEIRHLINASPSLEKFTLKLRAKPGEFNRGRVSTKKLVKCPHYNIKEVEFIGFVGYKADLELAQYLLHNAIMLEKFVINVSSPHSIGEAYEFDDSKQKRTARKRAKQLEDVLPRPLDFQIIN